jgi:hypothetical protein
VARLDTEVLKNWLEAKILAQDDKIKVVAGKIDDTPDRMGAMSRGRGRGRLMEGVFETVTYQVECRGGPNNLQDAENIAQLVDDIMLNEASNLEIEGCYLLSTEWAGSGPQQSTARDADFRYSYDSNYSVTSAMD